MHELARGALETAVKEAFGGLNRSSHSGPVSIRFTPAPPRSPRPLPTYLERQTVRTFTCPTGGHRAVIYDLLTVCPYCGPDTPPRAVFDDNLAGIGKLLEIVEMLPAEHRAEIDAAGGTTALAERALGGAVAATQNLAKQLHARAGMEAAAGSPWQNVERVSKQWVASFGLDPVAGMPAGTVASLRLGFERRHILEHNGGIVDERYFRDSGDTIAIGRRVRFDAAFVRRFMLAASALADALKASSRPDGQDSHADRSRGDQRPSGVDLTDLASRRYLYCPHRRRRVGLLREPRVIPVLMRRARSLTTTRETSAETRGSFP